MKAQAGLTSCLLAAGGLFFLWNVEDWISKIRLAMPPLPAAQTAEAPESVFELQEPAPEAVRCRVCGHAPHVPSASPEPAPSSLARAR